MKHIFAASFYLLFFVTRSYGQPDKIFQLDQKVIASTKALEARALVGNDSVMLAEAYYLLGKTYADGGALDKGTEYLFKSLRILERGEYSYALGRLYVELAANEHRFKRFSKELEFLHKAVRAFEKVGSDKGLWTAYLALGYRYELLKNYRLAELYLRMAEKASVRLSDSQGLAEVSLKLGRTLLRLKSDSAFLYFEKARAIFEEMNMPSHLAATYLEIAMANMDIGNNKKAESALLEANRLLDSISFPMADIVKLLLNTSQRFYARTGKWKEAYEFMKKMNLMEYERLGIQKDSVIHRLKEEFEMEKKEVLVAEQQNEIKLQQKRNYFLFAALCLSIVFIAIFFHLYQRNQKLSKHNAHLVREQGHRILNHLQMISNMLQLNSGVLSDPEAKATLAESELRVQSIALLQKGLYSKNSGAEVFLPEYFTLLTDHILEVSGYEQVEKRLEIEAVSLHPDRALPVALILNELVTNACKYAFPGHPSPKLTLKCRQEKGRVYFGVADNGPGFAPSLPGTEQSFGMQLIRIQAEQLYAVYSFQSDPETGGTRFEMEFSA